jgi:hypothetical protein
MDNLCRSLFHEDWDYGNPELKQGIRDTVIDFLEGLSGEEGFAVWNSRDGVRVGTVCKEKEEAEIYMVPSSGDKIVPVRVYHDYDELLWCRKEELDRSQAEWLSRPSQEDEEV